MRVDSTTRRDFSAEPLVSMQGYVGSIPDLFFHLVGHMFSDVALFEK